LQVAQRYVLGEPSCPKTTSQPIPTSRSAKPHILNMATRRKAFPERKRSLVPGLPSTSRTGAQRKTKPEGVTERSCEGRSEPAIRPPESPFHRRLTIRSRMSSRCCRSSEPSSTTVVQPAQTNRPLDRRGPTSNIVNALQEGQGIGVSVVGFQGTGRWVAMRSIKAERAEILPTGSDRRQHAFLKIRSTFSSWLGPRRQSPRRPPWR